ncbi:phosphatidylinositol polyphosphate 5-phosphatase type IV-like [Paramacrobiotus metropolitanus]|uniref:phosphatidylinositol polyphosphate 5-phosphatase type IV-like n=1 Tax=Paramacrobiotus metropolitanus TaxID=2943436 RepID=UPI002445BABF|nr:phosphatidylinositol polyphosphate 5-phosphatase type IV-like [Paramacrobiotus metropolitanus]
MPAFVGANGQAGPSPQSSRLSHDDAYSALPLQVFILTWNTNKNLDHHEELQEIFTESGAPHADLIAVGLQEVPLNHSQLIKSLQIVAGRGHILYAAESLGTILLVILVKRHLLAFCSSVVPSAVHLRSCNCIRTKGSLAIYLKVFDSSFLFLTAHLAAGHSWKRLFKRTLELRKIHAGTTIPGAPRCTPGRCRFDSVDFVFWAGDFNFRLSEERKSVEKIVQKVIHAEHVRQDEIRNLMAWDQLSRYKMATTLRDFHEAPIDFLPTYKYDPRSHAYDTSRKQRIPSYTDRILSRSGPGGMLVCRMYGSTRNVVTSDHKPVFGLFEARLVVRREQLLEDMPLATTASMLARLYKRERRKAVRKRPVHGHISACGCGLM